ncbi:MAG: SpoIIE family protein phosphatase [Treponema sp.]|nr:SpoIIE family protein phosphatase [Treponema sp.]
MQTETEHPVLQTENPVRSYPNSIQKLARYFRTVLKNETIAALADDLDGERRVPAVCVVDEKLRPLGVVKRDKIFLLLGKRFGRELMGKSRVQEITEEAPVFSGETNILVLSRLLSAALKGEETEKENDYIILTGPGGVFSGMLSFRDLSNYFVDMTNRDIAAASILQERFLANADEPGNRRIQVNAWSVPAKGVGGDFYFIKNLGESRFFAALCDVSGKGISAALVVSMVWGFLRAHTINGGLRNLLIDLNDSIISTFHLEKYLTGFFLICDSAEERLQFADMGHSHGVFIRNQSVHTLEKARVNLPIGVEVDIKPVICRIRIKPADVLFVYTDGITEQDNPQGEEFGDRRLLDLVRECRFDGKKLNGVLPAALDNFRKNTPQRDDMTCLFFRF